MKDVLITALPEMASKSRVSPRVSAVQHYLFVYRFSSLIDDAQSFKVTRKREKVFMVSQSRIHNFDDDDTIIMRVVMRLI